MAELVIRRGLEEPDTTGDFTPHKPARPEKAETPANDDGN